MFWCRGDAASFTPWPCLGQKNEIESRSYWPYPVGEDGHKNYIPGLGTETKNRILSSGQPQYSPHKGVTLPSGWGEGGDGTVFSMKIAQCNFRRRKLYFNAIFLGSSLSERDAEATQTHARTRPYDTFPRFAILANPFSLHGVESLDSSTLLPFSVGKVGGIVRRFSVFSMLSWLSWMSRFLSCWSAVKNLLCFNIIKLSKTQESKTSSQRSGKTLCVHV